MPRCCCCVTMVSVLPSSVIMGRVFGGRLSLKKCTITVLLVVTRKCQCFNQIPADHTAPCRVSLHFAMFFPTDTSSVSSASWQHRVRCPSQAGGRSIVYIKNSSGPRTDPWGTPAGMSTNVDIHPSD